MKAKFKRGDVVMYIGNGKVLQKVMVFVIEKYLGEYSRMYSVEGYGFVSRECNLIEACCLAKLLWGKK